MCLNNTLVKNNLVNMLTNEKGFVVLDDDDICAREVKRFSCFYSKSSRSYRDMGVVRNAWKEAVEKLKVLEAGKCG